MLGVLDPLIPLEMCVYLKLKSKSHIVEKPKKKVTLSHQFEKMSSSYDSKSTIYMVTHVGDTHEDCET